MKFNVRTHFSESLKHLVVFYSANFGDICKDLFNETRWYWSLLAHVVHFTRFPVEYCRIPFIILDVLELSTFFLKIYYCHFY